MFPLCEFSRSHFLPVSTLRDAHSSTDVHNLQSSSTLAIAQRHLISPTSGYAMFILLVACYIPQQAFTVFHMLLAQCSLKTVVSPEQSELLGKRSKGWIQDSKNHSLESCLEVSVITYTHDDLMKMKSLVHLEKAKESIVVEIVKMWKIFRRQIEKEISDLDGNDSELHSPAQSAVQCLMYNIPHTAHSINGKRSKLDQQQYPRNGMERINMETQRNDNEAEPTNCKFTTVKMMALWAIDQTICFTYKNCELRTGSPELWIWLKKSQMASLIQMVQLTVMRNEVNSFILSLTQGLNTCRSHVQSWLGGYAQAADQGQWS
eukprot:Gb_09187 [translate_table: standard]